MKISLLRQSMCLFDAFPISMREKVRTSMASTPSQLFNYNIINHV
ncbi:MAG: hypothetical protein ACK5YB_11795 [Burkholderiales bacterium]